MNMAILLSGGVGSRITSDIPKQYMRVQGRMMVTYALSTLIRAESIDGVCVVADEKWREEILSEAEECEKPLAFAEPGENRQCSILNAMRLLPSGTETILIHDAARPCLTEEMLRSLYEALSGHDGVMPVLPMKDTVYMSRDGQRVSELLDRSHVFAGQAPELFRFEPYFHATESLLPERILEINGSTEAAILAGLDIVMIPGDEANFKVTTDADMARFREEVGKACNLGGIVV